MKKQEFISTEKGLFYAALFIAFFCILYFSARSADGKAGFSIGEHNGKIVRYTGGKKYKLHHVGEETYKLESLNDSTSLPTK